MTTLQFTDTHNLVEFLAKPARSKGFEQVVDFLNASSIRYALTVHPTIYTSCIEQFWTTVKVKTVNGEQQLQALVDRKKIIITEATLTLMGKPKRNDTEIPQSSVPVENVADEAVYEERDDSLERATTTATSLDAEQDRGNISKTQSKATPNEPSFIRTSSGGGPRLQDTMGDTIAQTMSENVSKFSDDPLLAGVYTPQSGEDSLQLKELMKFYTKLQQRVLDLENTKTAQAQEITSLKKRVKKLERKKRSRTHGHKRLYKVGLSARIDSSDDEASLGDQEDASKQGRKIHDIDADEDITLENVHDAEMFDVNDVDGDEIVVESEVVDKDEKGDVIKEPSVPVSAASTKVNTVIPTTATTTITTVSSRPRAKGIVFHEQEQAPTRIVSLQQPTQVKDKGKGKMVEEEPVKKISKKELLKLDEELAFKLQAEEDKEERLPMEKAQKVEEANIAWDDIQAKVEADYHSKRAGEALVQESSKKQKVDDDKETKELNQCMEIISDVKDDVTIEATPLSTKSPTIVDYKIYKEGKKSYFQIIRAYGNSQMYLTFGKMLKNFEREDLEVLWSIVTARFNKIEPMNYMDTFLHLNLKTMFEHHLEDNVWKNQQGLVKVLNWKLYDSCRVHCVTMQNILYYLLVEKMYPLTKHTLYQMFNDVKLQVDYECEMAFKLFRLVKKQLKEGYGRIVRIKSLLEVTAAKLVLLVQKLLLLVLKVNAAGIKVTTAERLQLLKG
ncbi:hypothetical protein Tco_0628874 [Tanacetum coccineum]|uniref:Uncharacterized protein n=1 Tax=Tanacetum coccineum TaxID=301880 RepID=A0ABQ4WRN4_9ASTR